jgi:hypothetical protein
MVPDQVQTLEAQHPISLRNAFQKATFRVVCADIARTSGCGSRNARFLRLVDRQISKLAA